MKYRAEIDGLRAIAVVPVILFHAGFNLFSGGFIGVDIFFVISGYLITSILIKDIENNRFSLIYFYERRARRILPALFFVMSVCIPFAWLWMESSQMKDFSESLVAISLFASNILFLLESGYFSATAEEKPLLHTWSLAVEEQFYLLFPIFLILFWRYGKHRVFWSIIVMTITSLMLSEWTWRNHPTANFYLAPTRAWELFVGSIAAFIVQKQGVQKNNIIALFGLLLIVLSIFLYNENIPFPSLYALAPVLGAMLLVLYASEDTVVAKLLSSKILVGLGLVSYSAYLWHQPLFAFARILYGHHPSNYLMFSLSVISIALAYLSWRFIENPFRRPESVSRRNIFLLSVITMCIYISVGLIGYYKDGYAKHYIETQIVGPSQLTNIDLPIYVIGDSHAGHLVYGLEAINSDTVVNLSSNGCIPFRNVDRYDYRFKKGACAQTMNNNLDKLKIINKASIVIISSMGPVYLDGTTFNGKGTEIVTGHGVELITNDTINDSYEIFEIGMRKTLAELRLNENLQTIFSLDIPELGIDNGCQIVSKEIDIFGYKVRDSISDLPTIKCIVSRDVYEPRVKNYKRLVFRILEDFPEVYVFDPANYFCTSGVCNGFLDDYGYLYRDYDHLSNNGSLYYANNLIISYNMY